LNLCIQLEFTSNLHPDLALTVTPLIVTDTDTYVKPVAGHFYAPARTRRFPGLSLLSGPCSTYVELTTPYGFSTFTSFVAGEERNFCRHRIYATLTNIDF
jgi:hypothetical protein